MTRVPCRKSVLYTGVGRKAQLEHIKDLKDPNSSSSSTSNSSCQNLQLHHPVMYNYSEKPKTKKNSLDHSLDLDTAYFGPYETETKGWASKADPHCSSVKTKIWPGIWRLNTQRIPLHMEGPAETNLGRMAIMTHRHSDKESTSTLTPIRMPALIRIRHPTRRTQWIYLEGASWVKCTHKVFHFDP